MTVTRKHDRHPKIPAACSTDRGKHFQAEGVRKKVCSQAL